MLLDYGYPIQKALEEVPNEKFKELLKNKYIKWMLCMLFMMIFIFVFAFVFLLFVCRFVFKLLYGIYIYIYI